MITSVVFLIIALVILGAASYLVSRAPFMTPEFKAFFSWFLIFLGVIIVVWFVWVLLGGAPDSNLLVAHK